MSNASRFLLARIVLTLAYSDQFNFPLSSREVWRRLLCSAGRFFSESEVTSGLSELHERGVVEQHSGDGGGKDQLWFLSEKKSGRVRADRVRTAQHSQKKLQEARAAAQNISKIPGVVAIAVTGSVAAQAANSHDDIDFMIITHPHMLWMIRPLVVGYAWLLGKRRSWYWEEPDSWCFNLWLTTESLAVPVGMRGAYGAYEVCQAEFVHDSGGVARSFYSKNAWVAAYLPHFFAQRMQQTSKNQSRFGFFDWMFEPFVALVNLVLFGLQYVYMLPKKTTEKVQYSSAFFHPRDTKGELQVGWLRRVLKHTQFFIDELVPAQVLEDIAGAKQEKKTVVFVTGVFDLLHQEHSRFLTNAAAAGDVLVVGVESDSRVRALKGAGRPHRDQVRRVRDILRKHPDVQVFVLPDLFGLISVRRAVLRLVRPDILAVSEHTPHIPNKQQLLREIGGEVRVVSQHNPDISTTKLLERL